MKPTTPLLTLLLTTTTTTALTLPRQPQPPPQHRLLHTLPIASPQPKTLFSTQQNAATTTESTRGGALLPLSSRPSALHATFRIPRAAPPTTGPTANNPVGVYAASFWLGIDAPLSSAIPATRGCTAAVRAGVDIFWDGTLGGAQTPFAWVQYGGGGQDGARGFEEGFAVAEGDVVRFTVEVGREGEEAGAAGEVAVVAENFGGNVTCVDGASSKPLRRVRQVVGSGEGLCGRSAAWAVEDFPLAGMPTVPVALANFTGVVFSRAGVTLAEGGKVGVEGAEVGDVRLQAQGGRLTKCEVVGGDKVKCTRVVGDS